MTPKDKSIQMMSWFDTYHIDEEKNVAFTFTHLTLEEKKYILTKSVDEILKLHKKLPLETLEYYVEVKQELAKL